MVLEEVTQTFRSARALQIDLGVRRGDVKLPIRQGRCRSISEGLVVLHVPWRPYRLTIGLVGLGVLRDVGKEKFCHLRVPLSSACCSGGMEMVLGCPIFSVDGLPNGSYDVTLADW
ncbi:unnamed protein product [Prunus armeniaca]|uniref:Uncharacterized protein n=1 Tax=Prunus armeniaca TaxID=36596 RepID=A0A6J5TVY9_PRUAR|nr:unnamed protein product [Prunus armeniaca]